ncbi:MULTISPECIES: glutamate--tRNA ligase [Pseudomonadota]|jgi:glutamyl-tRNA synthetase|uniref:glutamate--tRNA ligase n=1 Tax=Pseudomonadota TaxID=1224 RepID=UPI00076A9B5D|nr:MULTISPECIES: glutamate--tRNA ligase [Pseudomonadota]MAF60051.1 glutamate--tRNA ligase [Blastomonas sp.]|tara:strand:+ start:16583 stop:17908 length:1326 start_codon:yes stop_codon:yes gene_type:complete
MTITRFAPSPTGHLHIGNIRTALHNWMWAKKTEGRFILRIDDTDAERSREEYVEGIRADLAWLGLAPDAEYRQSERSALYEAAFDKLRAAGRVYPCYETAQELDLKRKIALGRGLPPVYDRAALNLTEAERSDLEAQGLKPHWRFRLDHDEPIAWDDLIRGAQKFDAASLSDPVIRRADGSWLYMLPSAIDDVDMAITHVVRGEDHVSNTAVQLQMFTALGSTPPAFAHEALLTGAEGKLSKRLGSLGVGELREKHILPQAIVALLARLGTSDPVEPLHDRAALLETFDFARFGRAPARFAEEDLERINRQLVHSADFASVADQLPGEIDEAIWHAIRPNIAHLGEVGDYWRIITGPVDAPAPEPDDTAYLGEARTVLEGLEFGPMVWKDWTEALKASTGRKGKTLFLPLRRALTGMDHGPDMAELLPLIGKGRALERLGG